MPPISSSSAPSSNASAPAAPRAPTAARATDSTLDPTLVRLTTKRDGQAGWRVRLVRGGLVVRAVFADHSFGGRAPALHVASAYRDAVLAVVPTLARRNPRSTRRQKRDRPHSDLSHVYFDPANACWLARVQVGYAAERRPPHVVTRRFDVATHGHDGARRRAEAERTRMLQALEDGQNPRDGGARGGARGGVTREAVQETHETAHGAAATHGATHGADRGGMAPTLDPSDPDYAIRRLTGPRVEGGDTERDPIDGDRTEHRQAEHRRDARDCPEGDQSESDPSEGEQPVGWVINLTRRARNVQMAFWDVTYGGRNEALFVARQTRDAMLSVIPPLTKRERRQIVRRTREPGTMPGVTYFAGTPTRASYWVATINLPAGPNGKRRNKARWFNIDKLGNDEARRQAEAERTRMLDELEDGDEPVLLNPTARALHEQLKNDQRD